MTYPRPCLFQQLSLCAELGFPRFLPGMYRYAKAARSVVSMAERDGLEVAGLLPHALPSARVVYLCRGRAVALFKADNTPNTGNAGEVLALGGGHIKMPCPIACPPHALAMASAIP